MPLFLAVSGVDSSLPIMPVWLGESELLRRSLPLTHAQYEFLNNPMPPSAGATLASVWPVAKPFDASGSSMTPGADGLINAGAGAKDIAPAEMSPQISAALAELNSPDPTVRTARMLELSRSLGLSERLAVVRDLERITDGQHAARHQQHDKFTGNLCAAAGHSAPVPIW